MNTESHGMDADISKIGYPQEKKCIEKIIDRHSAFDEPVSVANIGNAIAEKDQTKLQFVEAVRHNDELENQLSEEEMQVLLFNRYIEGIKKWEIETNKALKTLSTDISKLKELKKRELETAGKENLNNKKNNKLSIITDNNAKDPTEGCDNEMVIIGPNGTQLSRNVLNRIDWNLPGSNITRILINEIFGRKTLSFSSLSGKSLNRVPLDPFKLADITYFIKKKFYMSRKEIRSIIGSKCNLELKKDIPKINANRERFAFDKDFDFEKGSNSEVVIIGPFGTEVSRHFLNKIDWNNSSTIITCRLVQEIFGRRILALSSLSERSKFILADITLFLKKKLNISERDIRHTIAILCSTASHHLYFEETDETKIDANPDKQSNNEEVIIGPNGTKISRNVLNRIDWDLPKTIITRHISVAIFGNKTLRSSSLKGIKSKKFKLDPLKVDDIVFFLKKKLNMPGNLIRHTISKKCYEFDRN